ncbi:Biopterin-dependent aromatic amino acid hydroxylase-domain-containing protein [Polychytrium aggregatum]|uniref:Biopterin-dependent aromatic amino acid hydroxylase-domain-containing protein n=1 Tax=Polychytrium aggregatum TaxID=110093 RepID=UPI0022FDD139|nr:Biopterin-dependent aromatic amino acid hydroxylase-domain-containing protein [Polychytrium aggregatum]KAI9197322.1 Biopterin-dependent aromatic amino acid hydroxylase-domain-containing protein [Polychytrium aggregatum]
MLLRSFKPVRLGVLGPLSRAAPSPIAASHAARFGRSAALGRPMPHQISTIAVDRRFLSAYTSGSYTSGVPLKTTIYFVIQDRVGALDDLLPQISGLNISLTRIESRPSKTKGFYDFFIDFDAQSEKEVELALSNLRDLVKEIKVVSTGSSNSVLSAVPWFPRKIADLDSFTDKVLSYGNELDADHPGFTDNKYRERRAEITKIARTYRHGRPVPHIEYTPDEVKTWGTVFDKLTALYPTHACREHQYVFPLLIQNCGYRRDNIPQLEDVSRFMKDCTGWTIRPVTGLLSSRDFLNGLAFRVFHSTQYIRHHSVPLYTPEPDVCHELLGHVPLYADPDFADFSQEIGLASLGATDEDIQKLATIYWFTVEFGVTREGEGVKAYGAGLLSSFGELEYCLSDKASRAPFVPEVVANTKYPITSYQPLYFVTESFKEMKEQVREYANSMERPFVVRYNALTQSIEVLDTKDKVLRFASNLRGDITRLMNAIDRIAM